MPQYDIQGVPTNDLNKPKIKHLNHDKRKGYAKSKILLPCQNLVTAHMVKVKELKTAQTFIHKKKKKKKLTGGMP